MSVEEPRTRKGTYKRTVILHRKEIMMIKNNIIVCGSLVVLLNLGGSLKMGMHKELLCHRRNTRRPASRT